MKRKSTAERVALWLLRRHPRRFRERYGRDVESALARSGAVGVAAWRLAWDALTTLIRSWRDELNRVRERRRRQGPGNSVRGLGADARYATRVLLRDPVHGIVTVLTLGLAIGANAAVFSVAWSVLLRTLPYDAPERTVRVEPAPVYITAGEGYAVSETLAGLPQVESAVAYTPGGSANLFADAGAEPVRVTHVGDGFFDVLGARLSLGRGFEANGDAGTEAVLSWGLWQRAFGGDRSIIGETIRLSGHAVTVTGVAAPEVGYPADTDVWLSYPVLFDLMGTASGGEVVARVTSADRIGEVRDLHESRERAEWAEHGDTYPEERSPRLIPLRESLVGPAGDSLKLLMGASGLVLLLGCVNLAGLSLARNAGRRGEFVMRRALGAGRSRLVRMILVESLVVAGVAGIVSLAFVVSGRALLVGLLPSGLPGLLAGGPGVETFGFVALLVLSATLLVGMVPAAQLWLEAPTLPGAAGRLVDRRRRLHPALVIAEVALAVVLVVSAGLLGRSVSALREVPLGFDTEGVYAFEARLPWADSWDAMAFLSFAERVRERLSAEPGVTTVGIVSRLPLSEGIGAGYRVWPEGADEDVAEVAGSYQASSTYFDAMGTRFLAGGPFAEDAGATGTIIVSRKLAESLFGTISIVGRQVRIRRYRDRTEGYTIAGVVEDVRTGGYLDEAHSSVYFPFHVAAVPSMAFALRVADPPADLPAVIRQAVSEVDGAVAPFAIRSMRGAAGEAIAARDALALVSGLFGLAALLLAVLGIYGLVAQSVIRRRREMGVRLAVGARGTDLLGLVLRGTLTLAGAGIVLGLLISLGATRLLAGFLFGVGATDGVTFAAVAAVVLVSALGAALGPAARAARIDPLVSLRME